MLATGVALWLGLPLRSSVRAQVIPGSPSNERLVRVIAHVPRRLPPPPQAGYLTLENGVLPIALPLRDPRNEAVVVLCPRERGPLPPSESPIEVLLSGYRFSPALVVAPPRALLVLRNQQKQSFSLVHAEPSGPGVRLALPAGQSQNLQVPDDGRQMLSLHAIEQPQLRLTVVVSCGPSRRLIFGDTGEVGVSEFSVAPGPYVVRLYLDHALAVEQPVRVADHDAEVILRSGLPVEPVSVPGRALPLQESLRP